MNYGVKSMADVRRVIPTNFSKRSLSALEPPPSGRTNRPTSRVYPLGTEESSLLPTRCVFAVGLVAMMVLSFFFACVGLGGSSLQQPQSGGSSIHTSLMTGIQAVPSTSLSPVTETLFLATNQLVQGNDVPPYTTALEPHFLVYDRANGMLYVTEQAAGQVAIINVATNQVVGNVSVGVNPQGMALDTKDGYLYVANVGLNHTTFGSRIVSVINVATDKLVTNITTGMNPWFAAYVPETNLVYVTNHGSNNVSIINCTTNQVVGSIGVGAGPAGIAYDPSNGLLYVADNIANNVSVVNTSTNKVLSSISLGVTPGILWYDPIDGHLWISNWNSSNAMAINTTTNTVWRTVGTGLNPQGVVGDPTNTIYVTDSNTTLDNITAIDGSTGAELGSITVGWHPAGIIYVPTNGCIYLANLFSDTVSIIHLPPAPPLTSRVVFGGLSSGTTPLNVTMTARASGGIAPYSYTWEFGDGSAGTGMMVTHTYQCSSSATANGTCVYHINLTTTDSNSTSVVSRATVSVSIQSSLLVSVVESPSVGVAPLAVSFTADAAGGSTPYAFSWVFGDGTSGSGAAVQHVYQLSGTYTAAVTASDSNGAKAMASTMVIVYPAPQGNQTGAIEVAISASNVTGLAPLTTQFTASAANGEPPYTFNWDFGDGSSGTTGSSVSHTYTVSGDYTAVLSVSDSAGNAATTGVMISVGANATSSSQLRALVTAYNLHGYAPLSVTFLPSVMGGVAPYNLVWSFGDGSTTSTTSSSGVTHTYSSAGRYTPTLKITDAKGTVITWDENAQTQTHYVVSVDSKTPTSATPFADWVIIVVVIIVVLVLVFVLHSRKTRRPPPVSSDQKGGPVNPYEVFHSQGQPQGGTDGNGASRPQRPLPPAAMKASDDPLGDSI